MTRLEYRRWDYDRATWIRQAAELYDQVRVQSYGSTMGARLVDVGRTGTVVKINRTRVLVNFGSEERAIDPVCLQLSSRQADRKCPVCDAEPGAKCSSEHSGRRFEHSLMHRER